MARWTKNHRLELGAVLFLIGLLGTIFAIVENLDGRAPGWLRWYEDLVRRPEGNFNLILLIVAPVILIWGAVWLGEQLVYRRRFERLLDTPKKSEFVARRSEIEDVARRLPDGYKERISEKEDQFVSKRA